MGNFNSFLLSIAKVKAISTVLRKVQILMCSLYTCTPPGADISEMLNWCLLTTNQLIKIIIVWIWAKDTPVVFAQLWDKDKNREKVLLWKYK